MNKIDQEKQYVEFLKKRLESENYKQKSSDEEYQKTKDKYDKAKFKLKMMMETKVKKYKI